MIKQLARETPYWLRIVIAILFLNGFFAFLSTLFPVFGDGGFFLDPRILNIFIAFGLARKNRVWYVLGVISVSANVVIHILRLSEFSFANIGIGLYFLLALAIDIFQLYVLLSSSTRVLYFKKQGES